ncbi:MAG: polysaccharide deacetylase [Oscillospiraceae bacterium]|nr:polysaccharide deacetylase [Oscillospiraceae bacterium]
MKWILFVLLCTVYAAGETPPPEPAALENLQAQLFANYDENKAQEVPSRPTAYLTIDDGPSEEVTARILDVLKEHDVKATFFVLPHEEVDHLYERILAEGHAIGNHSYSHDYTRLYAADDGAFFREDITQAAAWLADRFGHKTTLFRFPGGSWSWDAAIIAQRKEILAELGYRVFDWDVSTGDTDPSSAGKDPNALISNAMSPSGAQDKRIILMHDSADKQATAEALPELINRLRAEGYGFATLEQY